MDVCIRESNGGDMMITAGGWKRCQEKCMTQKHRPILSTKSLLSAHCRQATCYIIIHVTSWSVYKYQKDIAARWHRNIPYTSHKLHVNCFQVCTYNEITPCDFHRVCSSTVCSCIYSYTAIMKIKWDSEESLSWVMQMMIIKKWCIAIMIVLAVFVCKFNIQLLLSLIINI